MTTLKWIENWFQTQCNGDWEQAYGIKIESLNNPGWDLVIDLSETELKDLNIDYTLFKKSKTDWYGFSVKNNEFVGLGDPHKLEFLLALFREIVEKSSKT